MKFLQLLSTYGEYVREFYVRHSGIESRPYAEQNAALVKDGYSIVHMFARYLGPYGFDPALIFADCEITQRCWAAEQGLTLQRPENWRHEIAARQVNAFRPDILYITEPVYYDRRFLDLLEYQPRMVIGWKAAAIPAGLRSYPLQFLADVPEGGGAGGEARGVFHSGISRHVARGAAGRWQALGRFLRGQREFGAQDPDGLLELPAEGAALAGK
jgi:hypothetical protein